MMLGCYLFFIIIIVKSVWDFGVKEMRDVVNFFEIFKILKFLSIINFFNGIYLDINFFDCKLDEESKRKFYLRLCIVFKVGYFKSIMKFLGDLSKFNIESFCLNLMVGSKERENR